MKRLALLPLVMTLVFAFALVVQAHYEYQLTPVAITAKKADLPVTIDGKLDEPVWADAEEAELVYAEGVNDSNVFYRFKVLYDDKYIYVAVIAKDNVVNVPYGGPLLWNVDSIEVCFDFPHDAVYSDGVYRFMLAPVRPFNGDPQTWVRAGADTVGKVADEIAVAGSTDDQGYVIEMAVDLTRVNYVPKSGQSIGFELAANNNSGQDRTGIFVWAGTAYYFQDAALYGDLVFE